MQSLIGFDPSHLAAAVLLRRHEAQLGVEAERASPGPLAPSTRQGAR